MSVQIFQYPADCADPKYEERIKELKQLKADGWKITKGPCAPTLEQYDTGPKDKTRPSILQLYLIKD